MTPSLFDLPLRIGDAAALAAVLIDCVEARPAPVTAGIRTRVAARLAAVKFACLRPVPPSLERDPTHPSALYICVDGVDNQPLLLRVAPASTPSSGLFPNAILIGRTRVGPLEVVLNAVPFGPADHGRIRAFSERVNKAFLPRQPGSCPVTAVKGEAAFEEFRELLRATGQNQAAFAAPAGANVTEFYFAVVWAAIRAGWREGYALESRSPVAMITSWS